jgi:DNA repair protein RecO (recombination protein O)
MRLFTYSALILRTRSSGESNREAWILTAEAGILRATVFGGPKSRLRAHVEPYHRGKLWIYRDPVRDSHKITDFDVQSWKPGIRESYERSAAAAAIAETVLAGYGGGGAWEEAFSLADASLDALEAADERGCERSFIHFLWNWAGILGIRPSLDETENAGLASDGPAPGNTAPGGLGPGARRWLKVAQELAPPQMARSIMDDASTRQARLFVTNILGNILGKRLGTWDF